MLQKTLEKNECQAYVPRFLRFGAPSKACLPSFESMHDVQEAVPVLDENNKTIGTITKHILIPPKETIGKFKASDFDIAVLQSAGVPLSVVNINPSRSLTYAEIERAIDKVGSLEQLAKEADRLAEERKSWFEPKTEPDVEPSK